MVACGRCIWQARRGKHLAGIGGVSPKCLGICWTAALPRGKINPMSLNLRLYVFVPGVLLTILGPARAAAGPAQVDFDRDIAPLLARRCLDCHSGSHPKGRLDLSRKKS